MAVFEGSRYTKTSIHVYNEEPVLSTRVRATFDLTNATLYTWVESDTIDGVAYRFYSNAQLWWAILDSNRKYQSEVEIKVGDVLVIPSYEEVVRVLE